MSLIAIEDLKKVELKVARVVDVQEIAGADKIWRLTIEVGLEKKEIVAGIKMFYSKEQLLGKNVVVVNNLTPAVIRGVESNGMLLAARDESGLTLVTLDKPVASGSAIG